MKYFNAKGEEQKAVANPFKGYSVHSQLVKDYLVALQSNARQWSANTQTRSEVNHSTKKPHKQKGTGNARQGSLAAPQYKGGGVVFGPKPKFDVSVKVNQKEKRKAISSILADKIEKGKVTCVENEVFSMKKPKTKEVVAFLKQAAIEPKGVLFVGHVPSNSKQKVDFSSFQLSAKNLPRSLFVTVNALNGYDVAASRHVVLTKEALNQLAALADLKKKSSKEKVA